MRRHKSGILARWYETQFNPERLRRFPVSGTDNLHREAAVVEFLTPLFALLAAYFETSESRFRDVYLNERLRYAPHREDPAVRLAFFSEVIPPDEAAILNIVSAEIRESLQQSLRDMHASLLAHGSSEPVNLLALGDCLMTELRAFLPAQCRVQGIDLEMRELYFSAVNRMGISTEDVTRFLKANRMDLIGLSFLTYEGLPLYSALLREAGTLTGSQINERVTVLVKSIREFIMALRDFTDAPFLLHNASGLPLTRWRKHMGFLPPLSRRRRRVLEVLNRSIRELADHTANTILIDEWAIASERGHREMARAVIPARIAKHAHFHTAHFGRYLAEMYADIVRSFRGLRKAKVLLVDFDGTLWDGVMAEGGVNHHHDRQKLLRQLKEGGMLLVAVSKNNPSNVRWNEMTLQQSDFALMKITWNPKVQSIREAADVLDLGVDSFAFIDDNPAECDLVRTQVPGVQVLDARDAYTWRSMERLLAFPNTRETEEARARTEQYRTQAARREALVYAIDYPAMMASLEMKVRFGTASRRRLDRVGELIQRTNQFNTTTIRYSKAELQALLQSSRHAIYFGDVSDKFGNLGIVAVVIIERRNDEVVFDSFVMSCRAMGFGLEQLMLRMVMDSERSATRYVGRFIATDRNSPASTLYTDAGFVQRTNTEWVTEATSVRPGIPSWISVVQADSAP
ncbi:MAG: HAD-IIIC family phosphatase [Candidatus Acidiferrales bacterium]